MKTIDQQRAKYKFYQDRAAAFGIPAAEFNERVRTFRHRSDLTPAQWVFDAWQLSEVISGGRCCPKAECIPCVCEVSYTCPDHGVRCRGSHD